MAVLVKGKAVIEVEDKVEITRLKAAGFKVDGAVEEPEPVQEPEQPDLDALTVDQLKELAGERQIDLAGANKKAEIIERIQSA